MHLAVYILKLDTPYPHVPVEQRQNRLNKQLKLTNTLRRISSMAYTAVIILFSPFRIFKLLGTG